MLSNFWKLNGNPIGINKKSDFRNFVFGNDEIKNIIYWPEILEPTKEHPRFKIENKTFSNVSFTKTTLKDIDFTSCHFEDCLFIGSIIENCKFRKCTFLNVNTDDIQFKKTYINPFSFVDNYSKKDLGKANLAVHLFQQLLNNSRDEEQSEFARVADYNFKKWQGRLSKSKFKLKKPYPISRFEYMTEYIPNWLYRWSFGYGLRLRNFLFSFSVVYVIFFTINLALWSKYKLEKKDLSIDSFDPSTFGVKANFFYTTDVTTQLIDSQFQPTTDIGMFMLTFQGFTGFVLFTFLITILINKFVK
jgi:uncharacterized protein YjbI with pentapeptide repeats